MKTLYTLALALLLASPVHAAESWFTAMTPLDPRPPLPKPTEPDGTGRDGPFRSPAPAIVKASTKAKPKPKATPKPPVVKQSTGCQCEPCECSKADAPQAPAIDSRLTRDAQGYYHGTAPGGQRYYSTNPDDVLRAITTQPYVTTYTAPAAAYCTTGTCPR